MGAVLSGPAALALNPLDKNGTITLTNGDKTATKTSGGGAWVSARSVTSHDTGKYYYEAVMTEFTGSFVAIGLANATALLTTFLGANVNGLGLVSDGRLFRNGSNTSVLPAIAEGSVVQLAVDLDANLLWLKDDAGLWNNSGTANPATGVGGLILSTGMNSGEIFAGVSLQLSPTDSITVNFGTDPFVYVPPSGFAAWG